MWQLLSHVIHHPLGICQQSSCQLWVRPLLHLRKDVHICYRKLCFLPGQKEIEGGAYCNGFYSVFKSLVGAVLIKFFSGRVSHIRQTAKTNTSIQNRSWEIKQRLLEGPGVFDTWYTRKVIKQNINYRTKQHFMLITANNYHFWVLPIMSLQTLFSIYLDWATWALCFS